MMFFSYFVISLLRRTRFAILIPQTKLSLLSYYLLFEISARHKILAQLGNNNKCDDSRRQIPMLLLMADSVKRGLLIYRGLPTLQISFNHT